MADFMLGVAAGLNARKNNGAVQTPASSGLRSHFDFSYRDRTDVTAKRRYQVKVPIQLMAILGLVFLLIPGLIFLQKEMHIHEDHHVSHYKTEKYVNVNTKEVWDNFKQATTTDDVIPVQQENEGSVDATSIKQQTKDRSGDRASDLQQHNHTGPVKSVVHENKTKPFPTTAEKEENGDTNDDDSNLASEEESSPEKKSASFDKGNENDLSSTKAAPISPSDAILVEGNNDGDTKMIGTIRNSTASKNISDRRRRRK